jgi:hypothetical protein
VSLDNTIGIRPNRCFGNRKLLIALWRMARIGEVPHGAALRTA